MNYFKIEYSSVDFADFHLNMTDSFNCFILSGGSLSIKNTPAFRDEKELIKQAPKPIFGICSGFQMIAYVSIEIIGDQIQLSWDSVTGAISYQIWVSDDPNGTFGEERYGERLELRRSGSRRRV